MGSHCCSACVEGNLSISIKINKCVLVIPLLRRITQWHMHKVIHWNTVYIIGANAQCRGIRNHQEQYRHPLCPAREQSPRYGKWGQTSAKTGRIAVLELLLHISGPKTSICMQIYFLCRDTWNRWNWLLPGRDTRCGVTREGNERESFHRICDLKPVWLSNHWNLLKIKTVMRMAFPWEQGRGRLYFGV